MVEERQRILYVDYCFRHWFRSGNPQPKFTDSVDVFVAINANDGIGLMDQRQYSMFGVHFSTNNVGYLSV